MKTNESTLTRRQEAALVALLNEGSVAAAAASSKISESTIWRWLRDEPEFQRRYQAARQQLVQTAIARLQSASDTAINTLTAICEDSTAPATARIAAARAILSGALRGAELSPGVGPRPRHKHLCDRCTQVFECEGADCEPFEFQRCPVCRFTPRESGREKGIEPRSLSG